MALLIGRIGSAAGRGMMRGGMGDFPSDRGAAELRKLKRVVEDLKSGKISVNDLDDNTFNQLGGKDGIAKSLNGRDDALQKTSIEGRKSFDVVRKKFDADNNIEEEKIAIDKNSFKAYNGSLNVTKSISYDKSRTFNKAAVDQVPTSTPKPGPSEANLESGRIQADTKNQVTDEKKFTNDMEKGRDINKELKGIEEELKNLKRSAENGITKEHEGENGRGLKYINENIDGIEKDLDKSIDGTERDMDKNVEGEDEISIESKSLRTKAKSVAKHLKEHDKTVNDDNGKIGENDVNSEFGANSSFSNPGSQRLSRNIAHQNARKASLQSSTFSKTSSTAGLNLTGGGSKSVYARKAGSYDPARGQRSEGWIKKAFDPVRKVYDNTETLRNGLNSINDQLKQVNDPANALMEIAKKQAKDAGIDTPVGGDKQNNNINNNNLPINDNFISKKGNQKSAVLEARSERSNIEYHRNSTTLMVEHRSESKPLMVEHRSESKISTLEHHSESKISTLEHHPGVLKVESREHNTAIKALGSHHEDTPQRNGKFFDQTRRNPSKEGDIVQQKEGSDNTPQSMDVSDAEKNKLEFIDSFNIKRLPEDVHETARKLAENVYKDAQKNNTDINKIKNQIQKQLEDENFRDNLTEVLRQERAMSEAEKSVRLDSSRARDVEAY